MPQSPPSPGAPLAGASVFVTGATGVVGRRLIPLLVARGCRVTAVGRSPAKRAGLEAQGARGVPLDLFDPAAVRQALDEAEARVLVNLATHIPSTPLRMMLPWEWRENDRLRRDGSAILAGTARALGVERFIQESFAPIYEDAGDAWIDEEWPVHPAPYNRTVLDAEASASSFSDGGGIGVVLRFAGFYGPDAFLETMARTVERGWSPLPGAAGAYWSSLAHDDAATAVAAALEAPAGIYNVCDDAPLTRREFADALARAVSARPPRMLPSWLAVVGGRSLRLLSRSQRISNRRFREATGWSPRWSDARTGLRAAIQGARG